MVLSSLTTHRFFPSRVFAWVLVQLEACVASVVGAGFVTEVPYFALWSITPKVFPFPVIEINRAMTAAASEFLPSMQRVTGTQGPEGDQHISYSDIPVLQHPDPPPPDIHITPPDDPLVPFPRDLTAFNITITVLRVSRVGPNRSQRSSCKEGGQTSASDAPQMLWPHPRHLAGVSGWQDVSDVQMDCLVRDIFVEKEIKTSDPAPLTEVEAGVAQDVTLESGTLDIRRSGMARDRTRHHHDQIRASAGSTSHCQIARASCH